MFIQYVTGCFVALSMTQCVRRPRNKCNRGERCENACIFIAEPKGIVHVQIRGDKAYNVMPDSVPASVVYNAKKRGPKGLFFFVFRLNYSFTQRTEYSLETLYVMRLGALL